MTAQYIAIVFACATGAAAILHCLIYRALRNFDQRAREGSNQ